VAGGVNQPKAKHCAAMLTVGFYADPPAADDDSLMVFEDKKGAFSSLECSFEMREIARRKAAGFVLAVKVDASVEIARLVRPQDAGSKAAVCGIGIESVRIKQAPKPGDDHRVTVTEPANVIELILSGNNGHPCGQSRRGNCIQMANRFGYISVLQSVQCS
jgi:hypothetical protein